MIKNIYKDICSECQEYLYDATSVHHKIFQKIYNAATSLYYDAVLKSSEDDVAVKVLVEMKDVMQSLSFPNEKEENIKQIFSYYGLDIKELLSLTPKIKIKEIEKTLYDK